LLRKKKRAFAELRPHEKRILQKMHQYALDAGTDANELLAPQIHVSKQNLKNKISAMYLKLSPLCVTNRPQLATAACAYAAWYGNEHASIRDGV
jgi:hypothetical protein